jgi:hypothetical protein
MSVANRKCCVGPFPGRRQQILEIAHQISAADGSKNAHPGDRRCVAWRGCGRGDTANRLLANVWVACIAAPLRPLPPSYRTWPRSFQTINATATVARAQRGTSTPDLASLTMARAE